MLRKAGPDEPAKYDYHFKHMTTVGEPIEPEVWRWYYNVVGKREAVIVDTWWQTENGGFLCSTKPAIDAMKPGSAGPGVPGIYPIIYDEKGQEVPAGSGKAGNVCIRNPWPGIFQTIWGDRERFVHQYYAKYCKNRKSKDWRDWPYFAADGAVLAGGRLLPHPGTRGRCHQRRRSSPGHEGAGIGLPDGAGGGRSGSGPGGRRDQGARAGDLHRAQTGIRTNQGDHRRVVATIETMIGKIARPKKVHIVPDMPKTRSGKIMRRVLAAISNTLDTGDITTLANPDVVEQIRVAVQGREKLKAQEGPEDLKTFGQVE